MEHTRAGKRYARTFFRQPVGDDRIYYFYDAHNFAPCGCIAYLFAGIPVAPVAQSQKCRVRRGHAYRCLICGVTWDDAWLDERTHEVHSRVG
jgi:hypothetical protein